MQNPRKSGNSTFLTSYQQFISGNLTPNETDTRNISNSKSFPLHVLNNKIIPKSPESNKTPMQTKSNGKRSPEQSESSRKRQSLPRSKPKSVESNETSKESSFSFEDEPTMAYECDICAFETIYDSVFKEHMLTHKKTRKETFHKCPKCDFKVKCKADVKKHMTISEGKPDHVQYCGLNSYSEECKGDLALHLYMHKNGHAFTAGGN